MTDVLVTPEVIQKPANIVAPAFDVDATGSARRAHLPKSSPAVDAKTTADLTALAMSPVLLGKTPLNTVIFASLEESWWQENARGQTLKSLRLLATVPLGNFFAFESNTLSPICLGYPWKIETNCQQICIIWTDGTCQSTDAFLLAGRVVITILQAGVPICWEKVYLAGDDGWKNLGQPEVTGTWQEAWAALINQPVLMQEISAAGLDIQKPERIYLRRNFGITDGKIREVWRQKARLWHGDLQLMLAGCEFSKVLDFWEILLTMLSRGASNPEIRRTLRANIDLTGYLGAAFNNVNFRDAVLASTVSGAPEKVKDFLDVKLGAILSKADPQLSATWPIYRLLRALYCYSPLGDIEVGLVATALLYWNGLVGPAWDEASLLQQECPENCLANLLVVGLRYGLRLKNYQIET